MTLIAPMLGWSQSDGEALSAMQTRPIEPHKTTPVTIQSATREVNLPQVLDRLALSAQQLSLWDFFRNKVEAYTSTYYRQKPIVPSVADAAPHQIGQMVDNLQNRLAALEDIESATKNLYASLTPEQQKTANELLILTIPTFLPSSSDSNSSTADARRKDTRPDAGKRSRRGGAGGAMAGSMLEN